MILAILVFNNHGKPRLVRFYQHFPEEIQQQIVRDTFHLVLKRDDNICNFLESGRTQTFQRCPFSSLIGGSDYKLIYRHYATLYFVFCVDSSESELGILDLIQVFVETLDKCFENVCELDLIFHMDKGTFPQEQAYLKTGEKDGKTRGKEHNRDKEDEKQTEIMTEKSVSPLVKHFLYKMLPRDNQDLSPGSSHMVHFILQEVVMGGMVLETNMNEIVAQMEAQNRLEKSEGGLSAAPARAVSAVKNINLPEIPRNISIGDLNIKVPNLSQFV